MRNWAGNYEFGAARVHCPTRVEEIQEIVARATRVKAVGTRHSFNDVADTPQDLVRVGGLRDGNLGIVADTDTTVSVRPGVRYGDVAQFLACSKRTLANFASLPHISVGGSVATGTHGSGIGNPGLCECGARDTDREGGRLPLPSLPG